MKRSTIDIAHKKPKFCWDSNDNVDRGDEVGDEVADDGAVEGGDSATASTDDPEEVEGGIDLVADIETAVSGAIMGYNDDAAAHVGTLENLVPTYSDDTLDEVALAMHDEYELHTGGAEEPEEPEEPIVAAEWFRIRNKCCAEVISLRYIKAL